MLYTLFLQILLLIAFFTVVYRKWRYEAAHGFSKYFSIGLYGGLQLLILGSLWPFAATGNIGGLSMLDSDTSKFATALVAFLLVSGAICILLIRVITPTRYQYIKGLRRAKKLALPRVPVGDDAATGTWLPLVYGAITGVVFCVLVRLAEGSGRLFIAELGLHHYILAPVLFTATMSYVQSASELWSGRGFWAFLGAVWALPAMASMMLAAVLGATIPAAYLLSMLPIADCVYLVSFLLTEGAGRELAGISFELIPTLSYVGLGISVALAVLMYATLSRAKRRIREREADAPRADASTKSAN